MDRDRRQNYPSSWSGRGGGRDRRRDYDDSRHYQQQRSGRRIDNNDNKGGRDRGSNGRRDIERERERHDREREERKQRYRERSVERRRDRSNSPSSRSGRRRNDHESLENVIPIDQRKRKRSLWDVTPRGFEQVPSETAKLSGLFPLPGYQSQVDMSRLQGLISEGAEIPNMENLRYNKFFNSGGANNSNNSNADNGHSSRQNENSLIGNNLDALKSSKSRLARRIVVSGINNRVSREDVGRQFEQFLRLVNLDDPPNETSKAVLYTHSTSDPNTVFIDLQTPEMATISVAFDQIPLDNRGAIYSIRRPADYVIPASIDHQIVITGLLPYLNEEQVQELLASFGNVEYLKIIRNKSNDESKGVAIAAFEDESLAEVAFKGLNGMDLGGQAISVGKASKGGIKQSPEMDNTPLSSMVALANEEEKYYGQVSSVIQILNAITPDDVAEDYDYRSIKQDVKSQCEHYGTVLDIKIPRPAPGTVGRTTTTSTLQNPGVGKIFVKFDSIKGSREALQKLGGIRFNDRTVITAYYPEENFDLSIF